MGKKNLVITLIIIITLFAPFLVKANTEIYKHVDQDGKVTFSNKPLKKNNRHQPRSSAANASSESIQKKFPEVSKHIQKKRDVKRRQLLEHELQTERALLANAKQILSRIINESEKTETGMTQNQFDLLKQRNKIKIIQERVLLHEKNIAAIKKELASL